MPDRPPTNRQTIELECSEADAEALVRELRLRGLASRVQVNTSGPTSPPAEHRSASAGLDVGTYQALFDHMLNGLAYCRMAYDASGVPTDFKYLQVNVAFERLTGLRSVTGRWVSEVIPGLRDHDPALFEVYGRVAKTGVAERFEMFVDTMKMWFAVSVYCPKPEHFVAIFDVITGAKERELALRESEARYRLVAEHGSDVIWLFDLASDRFSYISPSVERLSGYTPDEACKQGLADTLEASSLEFVRRSLPARIAAFEAGDENARTKTHQLTQHRKDGSTVPTEVVSTLVADRLGHASYIQGISRDISERCQAEAERDALRTQLAQSQKMEAIGRLAGGVAHDFNNLLTVISAYADLLASQLPPRAPAQVDIGEIKTAVERAAGLTRQLLAFSRRQIVAPAILDLSAVVLEMQPMLRRLIGEDIELRVDTAQGAYVKADRAQIEQVVMNLAVNARDAMPGGGTLSMMTTGHQQDVEGANHAPFVRLTVTDTGHGMDDATRDRVFEPFFTTKPVGQGTGLGLATVHGIVEQSGGSIRVESRVGCGTEFTVCLPLVGAPPAHPAPPARMRTHGRGESILLVEDEAAILSLAVRILRQSGYTVIPARNGAEARAAFSDSSQKIDLLVTDLVLPGASGREIAAEISGARGQTKVLFISGYTDDAAARAGVSDRRYAFLGKPFTGETLTSAVRHVLDES